MGERDYLRHDWEGAPRGWGGSSGSFFASHPGTKILMVGLIAIHVLLAILKIGSRDAYHAVWEMLALHPHDVLQRFRVWQLVTGNLLHASLIHLLFNLILIWFFGRRVEERLGLRRYVWFTLFAALSSTMAYLVWAVFTSTLSAMLGASGVAMGYLILVACWYPRSTVLFAFVVPMRLWVLAIIVVGMDVLYVFEETGDIANAAHLGGALFGWLYYRYGRRFENMFGAIDRMADERKVKKEKAQRRRDADMRQEVDRILDKVNREGMAALTDAERKFLKQASGKLRS